MLTRLLKLLPLFIVLGLAGPLAAQRQEVRAVWLSRFEWPNANEATAKANIDNAMATIAANNFNTVFFQVRGQCDVLYPSPYEPWTSTFNWTDPGWDPLAYAINAAHAHGLEFHAYINTHTLAGPIPPAQTTPQHPYNIHGPSAAAGQSWLIHDSTGTPVASTDSYAWISPGVPEASWWTRRAVMHVIRNYDVDGVHFDRIRCPGPGYSYDPVTLARFNGEANPDHLAWGDFMRSQITRDLRNMYGEAKLYKKNVKFSAAPFGIMYKDATTHYQGNGTQATLSWYQDGWGWMRAHCVDFLVPQIYWQTTQYGSSHPFELLLADWMEHAGGRLVVAGSTTGDGSKSAAALLDEFDETRVQNAAGHCTFSYGSMGNYWQPFKTTYFDQPTTVPQMPWLSTPTTGYIVGHVRDKFGNAVTDAKINLEGDSNNYLSAYDGLFSILDVSTATLHNLSASKSDAGTAKATGLQVLAGEVTQVDLVLHMRQGSLSLNKGTYSFAEPVVITVHDEDLEGSGTIAVSVHSTTEADDEIVTLTETATAGIFQGSILVSDRAPSPADGFVSAHAADTLTVTYHDADDGNGTPRLTSATATVEAPPDIIVESRTPTGSVTAAPAYQEFIPLAGKWGSTTAKSTASGVKGSGGRYTGNSSQGAYAIYAPTIVTPGYYDVYITLPSAASGPRNVSPAAGYRIVHNGTDVSGTFDLSNTNGALANSWLLLAGEVKFAAGTGGSLRITNNNASSSDASQRFDMDAVKFVYRHGEILSSTGRIELDRTTYGKQDTARIQLFDGDLRSASSVTVVASSDSEPQGESVTLSPQGIAGTFAGQIALSQTASPAPDGALRVSHGDTISVTYLDENNESGSSTFTTATATIDGQPPVISNVTFSNITPVSATVSFVTDDPTTAQVSYGSDCTALTMIQSDSTPNTLHQITLSGLSPDTTYSLSILARDAAGNLTADNAGGGCYSFHSSGYPRPPFFDGFESGSLEFPWSVTGTNQYRSQVTSSYSPHSGQGHLIMDDSVNDSTYSRNEVTLTLDLHNLDNVTLSFWANLFGDSSDGPPSTPFSSGANFDGVAISADGNTWYEVQPLRNNTYTYSYAQYTVDLDAAVQSYGLQYNSAFKIRFNQYGCYSMYSGIGIDDVTVSAIEGDDMKVSPNEGFQPLGKEGGPFSPATKNYTLKNAGTSPVDWNTSHNQSWLSVQPESGTLQPGETASVTLSLTSSASTLSQATYSDTVSFTNTQSGITRTRTAQLVVVNPPAAASAPNPADGSTQRPLYGVLSWTGSPNATGYDVYLGTTNPPLTRYGSTTLPGFSYSSLALGTRYYWQVVSKGASGNTPGPVWSFTTLQQPGADYFTETFTSPKTNDLDNECLTFRPDGSPSFYRVCRETAAQFPTDPTGGTDLGLSDESSTRVVLSGGAQIPFYGNNYSSFCVGSNGHINFLSQTTTYNVSTSWHFAEPRIAMLWDDLDPGTGGRISCKQLTDRVVVTFENVPRWQKTDKNSFQLEMFFDGMLRLTHLGIDSTGGICGLSKGGGIPGDFVQSDLSAYGSCAAPGTPAGLTAQAVSSDAISLHWNDMSNNEQSFRLERSNGAQPFQPLPSVEPNKTSYLDRGLAPGTTYVYRIVADGFWGDSPSSNKATATTWDASRPASCSADWQCFE